MEGATDREVRAMRYLLLAIIIMLIPASASAGFLYLDYSPPPENSVYWFDYWGVPRPTDVQPAPPQAEIKKEMPTAPTPTAKTPKKKAATIIVIRRVRKAVPSALPDPPVVVPEAHGEDYFPIEEVDEPEYPEMPVVYYVHIFGENRGYYFPEKSENTPVVVTIPEPSTWILLLFTLPLFWRRK